MPMAKQARQIWTEKLGLVPPLPFSWVIFREIRHLATIPIFWSNQCKKSTNYKTRMDPRDLQKLNYTVLWLYYTGCTQKNQKKHNHPKAAAIRLTLLLFPMCTKPRVRYQNSEPPNQRHRSRAVAKPADIWPCKFRACGKDSRDKKPRARLIYITIRVN